jgi:hypothetical protein
MRRMLLLLTLLGGVAFTAQYVELQSAPDDGAGTCYQCSSFNGVPYNCVPVRCGA